MIYADLHTHTNHSDGTHEIRDVLEMAKQKGIQAIAITDHDTINHYDEVQSIGQELGLETIRGVEMSCYDDEVDKKIHVVGLWLNDDAPHVEALCNETLRCRDHYHRQLIQQFQTKGYDITYADAKKYSPYNIVFKMHIFLAFVEKYPELMSKEKYIELFASPTTKSVDSQMGYVDIKEGIQAIQKDGGVAIIAHPCAYHNYEEIKKYVGYGLQGIEISHPSMKEKDYVLTNELAKCYHLVKSGGSDFHDVHMTQMGTHGLTKEQYEELKSYAQGGQ